MPIKLRRHFALTTSFLQRIMIYHCLASMRKIDHFIDELCPVYSKDSKLLKKLEFV